MTRSPADEPEPPRRTLQVPIVRGMPVHEICDGTEGTVVGVTQAYCVYRMKDGQFLCVTRWQDLALGHVCPAEPLLPTDVPENDRRNAAATVLRELLFLERLGPLTPAQASVRDELTAYLCGE